MMNKKGIAASSAPIIWTVVIASLVLLIAGFIAVGSINSNANAAADAAGAKIDGAVAGIGSAVSGLQTTPSSSVCTNVNGCDDTWDVPTVFRGATANRVLTELTEDGMKDLFRNMDSIGVDLDDDVDINWANVWRIGELTTDRDPRFGLDDTRTVTFDLVIQVNYLDDSGDTQTDYYRVQGTIDEMENGLTSSDVHISDFTEVSKRFALPNR